MEGEIEELRVAISKAGSLPPSDVVQDLLLSIGVCARCVFRLFGLQGDVYSSSLLTESTLLFGLQGELHGSKNDSNENCSSPKTLLTEDLTRDKEKEKVYCSICLGILQFGFNNENKFDRSSKQESTYLDNLAAAVAEMVKTEGHQFNEFSVEISIPFVTMVNEHAFWLYLKNKYGSQDWFKEKFHSEKISIKDALKLSVINSLQNNMNAKLGADSFRIRFTYVHLDASTKLQNLLAKELISKKRKTGGWHDCSIEDSHLVTEKDNIEHPKCVSDASIRRALELLEDRDFSERFALPHEKVSEPCHLTVVPYRMSMYIGGRYLKYSRRVSQSRWIIDDERMGDASVEEIIGNSVLQKCRGDSYKFHSAGREDIDVRMLGSGRPFLVEVSNAKILPSSAIVQDIADTINYSKDKFVSVKNLKALGSEAWEMMREGESEKQKQYAAVLWISRSLTEGDIEKLSGTKDLEISQKTPIRVLHRRSPLERKRIIHWMKIEKIAGNSHYLLLHLCTQAGTYIKEFAHGDLGRTHPCIGSLLECRAEILQLDVTDVNMECFD